MTGTAETEEPRRKRINGTTRTSGDNGHSGDKRDKGDQEDEGDKDFSGDKAPAHELLRFENEDIGDQEDNRSLPG